MMFENDVKVEATKPKLFLYYKLPVFENDVKVEATKPNPKLQKQSQSLRMM